MQCPGMNSLRSRATRTEMYGAATTGTVFGPAWSRVFRSCSTTANAYWGWSRALTSTIKRRCFRDPVGTTVKASSHGCVFFPGFFALPSAREKAWVPAATTTSHWRTVREGMGVDCFAVSVLSPLGEVLFLPKCPVYQLWGYRFGDSERPAKPPCAPPRPN